MDEKATRSSAEVWGAAPSPLLRNKDQRLGSGFCLGRDNNSTLFFLKKIIIS